MDIKKTALLVRYGEIGLKKGNRGRFENRLCRNLKNRLLAIGRCDIQKIGGRIVIRSGEDVLRFMEEAGRVFGVVGVRYVYVVPTEYSAIKDTTLEILKDDPSSLSAKAFAVQAHRRHKGFPMTSEEIGRELGAEILQNIPEWSVNLSHPDVAVRVEVHKDHTYLSTKEIKGAGGLPVGTAGKLGVLLSGGIDSPVAGYMIQRRGAEITPIYFHSFPYTGDQVLNKIKDLSYVLAKNQDYMKLNIVHFTGIQEAILEHCNSCYGVILARRMMMRIAENIVLKSGLIGLVTGECLGQVASQTLGNMDAVGRATVFQIYRPLLSYDKTEIVALARNIGSYDISIRPYEDCCTLFVDPHPVTHVKMSILHDEEKKLDIPGLINESMEKLEVVKIK